MDPAGSVGSESDDDYISLVTGQDNRKHSRRCIKRMTKCGCACCCTWCLALLGLVIALIVCVVIKGKLSAWFAYLSLPMGLSIDMATYDHDATDANTPGGIVTPREGSVMTAFLRYKDGNYGENTCGVGNVRVYNVDQQHEDDAEATNIRYWAPYERFIARFDVPGVHTITVKTGCRAFYNHQDGWNSAIDQDTLATMTYTYTVAAVVPEEVSPSFSTPTVSILELDLVKLGFKYIVQRLDIDQVKEAVSLFQGEALTDEDDVCIRVLYRPVGTQLPYQHSMCTPINPSGSTSIICAGMTQGQEYEVTHEYMQSIVNAIYIYK
eukprot:g10735.t1